MLSKFQSRFRKRFSCETAVNYVINGWKRRQKKNNILAIFLDFKRAFETLDRDIDPFARNYRMSTKTEFNRTAIFQLFPVFGCNIKIKI